MFKLKFGLAITASVMVFELLAASSFNVNDVFGDGMVLQRGKSVRVAGTGALGTTVTCEFRGAKVSGIVGEKGRWVIELPAGDAGGPFELKVSSSTGARRIFSDILVGEVWFCSGQSNMELPVWGNSKYFRLRDGDKTAAAANDPDLRLLHISRDYSADGPCDDLPLSPKWTKGNDVKAVEKFSAVGYLFGKELRARLKVPVGLICGSWGGTPIEPWIPRSGFTSAGYNEIVKDVDLFAKCMRRTAAGDKDAIKGMTLDWIENKFMKSNPEVTKEALANWAKPGIDASKWTKCVEPFTRYIIENGVQWFRTEFKVPESWVGRKVMVYISQIDDTEDTYLDGERVGFSDIFTPNFWIAPRKYTTVLKPTANGVHVLAVRHHNQYSMGGFGKPVWLQLEGTDEKIDLSDHTKWMTRREFKADLAKIGVRPSSFLCAQVLPSVLFNAMVSPATAMNIGGVIWYQGCSNSDKPGGPQAYSKLQKTQIDSWRKAWRDSELPFLITQLAGFSKFTPSERLADDYWKKLKPNDELGFAPLREAQEILLDYPRTGVACTIDIGDHSDIHPNNKYDVAKRLAHEAMRIAFGDAGALPGPRFGSAVREGAAVRVKIRNAGDGLVAEGGKIGEHLFALVDASGATEWADAELMADGSIIVRAKGVANPVEVRYAYNGWQPGPNLYRKGDHLPVFPFRAKVK